jgi:hypothetical protein
MSPWSLRPHCGGRKAHHALIKLRPRRLRNTPVGFAPVSAAARAVGAENLGPLW